MKIFIKLALVLAIIISITSCGNSNSETKNTETIKHDDGFELNSQKIYVFYFHGSIRCHTCVAVDEYTMQYLNDLFPNEIKEEQIIYNSYDIDKGEGAKFVDKYEIYGQTMLFIKNNTVINKTDDAFLYASNNTDKWKQIVDETINNLLK